jgi:malonyl-CoA O-methyltransferase
MPTPDSSDPFRLDRKRVRASFDRASSSYEASAVLQDRVRDELLERLQLLKLDPAVVIDLGAGTGLGARALRKLYKRSQIIACDLAPGMLRESRKHMGFFSRFDRVCADSMRLPFKDASVDLIFTNLMLQWCDEPDATFAEVRRVLKPSGFFGFTTFGPDTLKELRSAWSQADGHEHVSRFLDMHDIGDALSRAGLVEPVLDVERIQLSYADVHSLMRDLKAIGAHNATAGRARGLTGKSRLKKMTDAYESFRREGRLPATYEVVYGAAWGTSGRPASRVIAGEVHVPVSSIRRRE